MPGQIELLSSSSLSHVIGHGSTGIVGRHVALPPRTRKIGMLGHSQNAACHWPYDTAGTPTVPTALVTATDKEFKNNKGYAYWTEKLTDGRVVFPRNCNYAISGTGSDQILASADAYCAAMVAAGASAVILRLFANDEARSIALATSYLNGAGILDIVKNYGLVAIIMTDTPRGAAGDTSKALTGAALERHMARRRWVMHQDNGRDVLSVDTWLKLAEPLSALGYMKAAKSPDFLHTDGRGAYDEALLLKPVIEKLWTPYDARPYSNTDIWSANNLNGAANNNPMLDTAASTGTKAAGVGGAGKQPDGYSQNTLPAGLTCDVTQGTDAIKGPYTQYVFGGTPTTAFPNFNFLQQLGTIGTKGFAVGGTMAAIADFDVIADSMTGVWDVDIYVAANGISARSGAESNDSPNSKLPLLTYGGPDRTPTLVITTGTTAPAGGLRAYFIQNIAVNLTVRVYWFRMISNPTGPFA